MQIFAGNDGSDYALAVNDRAENPLLHVLGNGNVGVGTYTPSKKLEVNFISPAQNTMNWLRWPWSNN